MGTYMWSAMEVRGADGLWRSVPDAEKEFPGGPHEDPGQPFRGVVSYGLYGWLADVRNYSMITPLTDGDRGWPEQLGEEAEHERGIWFGEPMPYSWVSLAELLSADFNQMVEDRRGQSRLTVPAGEGEKMTLREYLGEYLVEEMQSWRRFGDPDDVRILIYFY